MAASKKRDSAGVNKQNKEERYSRVLYQRCISAASRRCGNGSDAILETRRRRALILDGILGRAVERGQTDYHGVPLGENQLSPFPSNLFCYFLVGF